MWDFFRILYQVVPYVLMGAAFFWSVFELLRKRKAAEGKNKYGVEKETGKDGIFKRQCIIMIIAGVLAAACDIGGLYGYSVCCGQERYERIQEFELEHLEWFRENSEKGDYYRQIGDHSRANYYDNQAHQYMEELNTSEDEWISESISFYFNDGINWIPPIIVIVLFGFLFPLYMYPSKIARRKEHEKTTAIVCVNILGCTVIGWILAFMMANDKLKKAPAAGNDQKEESLDKLEKLKELCDKGVISQEEFEQKKKDILKL